MTLLALDLGTSTGYCVGTAQSHIVGEWSMKGGRFEGGGMRFVHMRKHLNDIHAAYPKLSQVYYEEVRRHAGVGASHAYGGYLATLTSWCEEAKIPYSGLPVGSIKSFWTSKGNASKEMMIAECIDRGYQPKTDNVADAIAIFHYGLSLT